MRLIGVESNRLIKNVEIVWCMTLSADIPLIRETIDT
jgi:hypothetical protein